MTRAPALQRLDHVHVHVSDRAAAERWYREVLGLERVRELEGWAADGGPLTLADPNGALHLALFERPSGANHATLALAVDAAGFVAWKRHLERVLGGTLEVVDHELSWSLYFADPDGNPFELTCYEHAALAAALARE
jgi:catechol 2,3-dioxygenase-like lactoylglutathione lyase family enzyme